IDSLSFIQASLEQLVENLSQTKLLHSVQDVSCLDDLTEEQVAALTSQGLYPNYLLDIKHKLEQQALTQINSKFHHFNKEFKHLSDDQKLLITQKGVYPYDYMNSFKRFEETSFPSIENCYSHLNKEHMNKNDYQRALSVWKTFNLKNLGEYHDLYLKTDILLLADVFENFRSTCISSYKLDPTHYYTLPGFAWDACLQMTSTKLDVYSEKEKDMYLTTERGIRGGISVIPHRYSKANNKYLQNYNPNEESKYIMYLDANNLYGWAMIQALPTGNFKWCTPSKFNENKIMNMDDDQETGYIFDVDLEYPVELHDMHNDYPLAPEKIAIQEEHLSEHSKRILKILNEKHSPHDKLVPNLWDKTNYVVHYRNLKLYLELGMKIKKINQAISFFQSKWLKQYIDFNTNKRKEATEDFEKDLYKLMNNAVFGKTMENVRKRIRYELVNNQKRFQKLVNDVTFRECDVINQDLVGVSRAKTIVELDKPISVGFAILELSKVLMYDFHYNTMKPKYGENLKLLFTDTDSLCYEVKTDDIYKDMKTMKNLFDFSEYPQDHPLFDPRNKKVIGKFKDETNSTPIQEFVGLRSK
ncbi:MAG TPA: hypothetical protein PLS50_06815, partial [Candidatus Dojkabacteria bacterium]|nr:hypothetical protein [Candidatus Dojkabacteria bacterium]